MWRNILWLVLWRICFIKLKGPFITNSSTLQQIGALMQDAGFQSAFQVLKKKVRKKFQSYFLSACFYLMVLKFPHRKPFKLLIFYFKQSKYFITEGYFITKFTSTYSCESFQQCIYFWSQEFTACQVLL